jgi:hypothetical protein
MKKLFLLIWIFTFLFSLNTDVCSKVRNGGSKSSSIRSHSTSSRSSKVGYSNSNPNVRYQQGYTKKNGTYVQTHYKTQSNKTNIDNYSTKGNINPYTGKKGYKAQDYSPDANNYGKGKQIITGSRGGQYYINKNGNKTYVPKR